MERYHDCFDPTSVAWFVGEVIKLEGKMIVCFKVDEAYTPIILSMKAERKFKHATEIWFCEDPFTSFF